MRALQSRPSTTTERHRINHHLLGIASRLSEALASHEIAFTEELTVQNLWTNIPLASAKSAGTKIGFRWGVTSQVNAAGPAMTEISPSANETAQAILLALSDNPVHQIDPNSGLVARHDGKFYRLITLPNVLITANAAQTTLRAQVGDRQIASATRNADGTWSCNGKDKARSIIGRFTVSQSSLEEALDWLLDFTTDILPNAHEKVAFAGACDMYRSSLGPGGLQTARAVGVETHRTISWQGRQDPDCRSLLSNYIREPSRDLVASYKLRLLDRQHRAAALLEISSIDTKPTLARIERYQGHSPKERTLKYATLSHDGMLEAILTLPVYDRPSSVSGILLHAGHRYIAQGAVEGDLALYEADPSATKPLYDRILVAEETVVAYIDSNRNTLSIPTGSTKRTISFEPRQKLPREIADLLFKATTEARRAKSVSVLENLPARLRTTRAPKISQPLD